MRPILIFYSGSLAMYVILPIIISILISILMKRDTRKSTIQLLKISIQTAVVSFSLLILMFLIIDNRVKKFHAIYYNVILLGLFIFYRFDSIKQMKALSDLPHNNGLTTAIKTFYFILLIFDSVIVILGTALSAIGALVVVMGFLVIGTIAVFDLFPGRQQTPPTAPSTAPSSPTH